MILVLEAGAPPNSATPLNASCYDSNDQTWPKRVCESIQSYWARKVAHGQFENQRLVP